MDASRNTLKQRGWTVLYSSSSGMVDVRAGAERAMVTMTRSMAAPSGTWWQNREHIKHQARLCSMAGHSIARSRQEMLETAWQPDVRYGVK